MDELAFWILVVSALGVFIFAGSVAAFMAMSRTQELKSDFKRLSIEVSNLRNDLANGKASATAAVANPVVSEPVEPEAQEEPLEAEKSDEASAEPEITQHPDQSIPEDETITSLDVDPPQVAAKANLEETLGTKWAVWVGGLALALGAVFLVKFSIDRGLLSPGVRIFSGLSFSAALALAGEWARRRGSSYSFAGYEHANIPAVLTAAGTMGAFATIYAAYQLYGMLGDTTAFIALGLVAVATTVVALLHGPLLAALGIVASYGAPFLVSSDDPSVIGLGLYVLAVAVSGFAVGRLRYWKWLAVASALGLAGYGMILHAMADNSDRLALALYVAAALGLTAYVFIVSLYVRFENVLLKHDIAAIVLPGLFMLLGLGQMGFGSDFLSALLLLIVVLVPTALAAAYSPVRILSLVAMGIAALGYLAWHVNLYALDPDNWQRTGEALTSSRIIREDIASFAWLGVLLAGGILALGVYSAMKFVTRSMLSIAGAFSPLLILGVAWIKLEALSTSLTFAFIALVLFAAFLFFSNRIYGALGNEEEGRDEASAAWSVASFVALAATASMTLEKGALTVAFAMLVPAIAFTNYRRPLPALRPLAVFASALWLIRIGLQPRIIDGDLGTLPIFNWLTWGYGIPALGFVTSAWLLAQRGRDRWLEFLEAIAVGSTIAAVSLILLHAFAPTEVFTPIDTLFEAGFMASVGAGAALGLLRISRDSKSMVISHAATWIGYIGMAVSCVSLLLIFNPWFTYDKFGTGLIFNGLLFAYVLPALLYGALGWYSRPIRPTYYYRGAMTLSALLFATWLNLSIRHFYHSDGLQRGATSDLELYTYSVVWLIIGVGILAAGIYFQRKLLRQIAVGIVALVVAKVFLIDMAGLSGIYRALSFIGLGLVLVAIGLVYQRILAGTGANPPEPNEDAHITADR